MDKLESIKGVVEARRAEKAANKAAQAANAAANPSGGVVLPFKKPGAKP